MDCEQARPALTGYLMEECSAEERKEIDRHLQSCKSCSEEMAELQQTMDLLVRGEASEEIPSRIRLAAEPAGVPDERSVRWGAFWRYPAGMAFAGAGLLCLAIALLSLFRTTVSYQNGNFQIAFGAPAVSSGAPLSGATPVAGVAHPLDRDQVLQLIADAMAAGRAQQQRESGLLAQEVSRQMEQQRQRDLEDMAGNLRIFQAAQTTMWKEQVQNQQLVSALMQQNGMPAPAQP
jgi:anti-sigma factor RsiW